MDWVTKQYVTKWKGFDPLQMAAVTLLMEVQTLPYNCLNLNSQVVDFC